MSEQEKPFREYWLGQTTMLKNGIQSHVEFLIERNQTHGFTHVVEIKALEQAQAENEKLKADLAIAIETLVSIANRDPVPCFECDGGEWIIDEAKDALKKIKGEL
jgi:hypothetical protein